MHNTIFTSALAWVFMIWSAFASDLRIDGEPVLKALKLEGIISDSFIGSSFRAIGPDICRSIVVNYLDGESAKFFSQTCKGGYALVAERPGLSLVRYREDNECIDGGLFLTMIKSKRALTSLRMRGGLLDLNYGPPKEIFKEAIRLCPNLKVLDFHCNQKALSYLNGMQDLFPKLEHLSLYAVENVKPYKITELFAQRVLTDSLLLLDLQDIEFLLAPSDFSEDFRKEHPNLSFLRTKYFPLYRHSGWDTHTVLDCSPNMTKPALIKLMAKYYYHIGVVDLTRSTCISALEAQELSLAYRDILWMAHEGSKCYKNGQELEI